MTRQEVDSRRRGRAIPRAQTEVHAVRIRLLDRAVEPGVCKGALGWNLVLVVLVLDFRMSGTRGG